MIDWSMGGYGPFIWPAYGISAFGIAVAVIWTWAGWRAAKARLARLEKDSP
jgi:heme exporter protein CcmD